MHESQILKRKEEVVDPMVKILLQFNSIYYELG